LTVVLGLIIPVATSLYQVLAQQRRYTQQDARATLSHIQNIRRGLGTADSVLDYIEPLIRSAGLSPESVWPAGYHGITLSGNSREYYINMMQAIVDNLRRVDSSGMDLANISMPADSREPLIHEVTILQSLLNQASLVQTYGEKLKFLRWSVKQSHYVLAMVERALGA